MGWRGQQHAPAASTPEEDPLPILQEAGWTPGPVWTGGKSRPHGIRSRTLQPVAQSLYRLSYTAHNCLLLLEQMSWRSQGGHYQSSSRFKYQTDLTDNTVPC